MSTIREFDIFVSRACEVVSTKINPSIGDVVDVREDGLVEDNLIGLTRVVDGVDGAFARGTNGRDAYIQRI